MGELVHGDNLCDNADSDGHFGDKGDAAAIVEKSDKLKGGGSGKGNVPILPDRLEAL